MNEKSINLVLGTDVDLLELRGRIGGNITNNMLVYRENGITYLIRPNGELICKGSGDILPYAIEMKKRLREITLNSFCST